MSDKAKIVENNLKNDGVKFRFIDGDVYMDTGDRRADYRVLCLAESGEHEESAGLANIHGHNADDLVSDAMRFVNSVE